MERQNIFFDLDGTLTDSMPGITRAVRYALNHYGIQVEDLNVLKPFVGPPLSDSFKEYYNFSDQAAADAVHVFREYYNEKGWMENSPYPGIKDMLSRLKQMGKTLYVATSKPEGMAKRVLEYFEMTEYFAFIGGASDDVNRIKKDDVIRYVMAECKVPAQTILMVGDRRHDIEGAHRAGVPAVGILYGYGSRKELADAGADWIVETPEALTEFFSQGLISRDRENPSKRQ